MLTIRLQRMGKKKAPTYRLVISEKARDTQAKSLEILGHYNPTQQPKVLELKVDKIKHYLSQGAQMSNTVHNILVKEGIIESKKKMKSVTITTKRREKIDAQKIEKEESGKSDVGSEKKNEPEVIEKTEEKSEVEVPVTEEKKENQPAAEKKVQEPKEKFVPEAEAPKDKPSAEEAKAEKSVEEKNEDKAEEKKEDVPVAEEKKTEE